MKKCSFLCCIFFAPLSQINWACMCRFVSGLLSLFCYLCVHPPASTILYWVLLLLFRCSVVSNSLQPHGLWPARLLHPWDFLGKVTGVGCHFLLQGFSWSRDWNCVSKSPALQMDSLRLSHQGSQFWVLQLGNIIWNQWVWYLQLFFFFFSEKGSFRDVRGSAVAKPPSFHCRVCKFHPWLGTEIPTFCRMAKRKKEKESIVIPYEFRFFGSISMKKSQ